MKQMSFKEWVKFTFALLVGVFFVRKGTVEKELKEFERNEEKYISEMEKQFPSLKKALIDDRNVYMADAVRKINGKHEKIVMVIGEGHVTGIEGILKDLDTEVIRLSEIMKRGKVGERGRTEKNGGGDNIRGGDVEVGSAKGANEAAGNAEYSVSFRVSAEK